ncbi:MAG TPA: hypothetical protein VI011_07465 [Asanoa sp.]
MTSPVTGQVQAELAAAGAGAAKKATPVATTGTKKAVTVRASWRMARP